MPAAATSSLSALLDQWLARLDAASVRRLLERATATPRRPVLLLLGLCALLYLPGIATIPPLDRDEPRYMQASKQMIETGDYTKMYFQDQFRNKKPIGIYWLQTAAVHLTGGHKDATWPYRLPSLLCATGTILLVYRMGCLLVGRPEGLLAALLLAVAPLILAESHVATTDSTLLFCTTLAQFNLIRVYLANREGRKPAWANVLLFWVALGFGILVKGPITPVVALTTSLSLMAIDRNPRAFRGIRPWLGIPLMLAIVLPWLVSIQIATHGAFLRDSFGGDFGKKLVSGQESHWAPPGFYTLLMAVTCWPASLLAVPALVDAWRSRRTNAMSAIGFGWVVPYLALIELVPTKLPHYILCAYPPVVLLCARFAWNDQPEELPNTFWRGLHWLYQKAWLAILPLAALAMAATAALNRFPLLSVLAGAILALGSVVIARLSAKGSLCRLAGSVPLLAVGALLAFGVVMPQLHTLWIGRTVADTFRKIQAVQPDSRLYAVGYGEPSLVFLTRTDTNLCGADTVEREYNPNMVALLPDKLADQIDKPLVRIKSVKGINYSKGKIVSSGIYVPAGSKALETIQPESVRQRPF